MADTFEKLKSIYVRGYARATMLSQRGGKNNV